MAGFVRLGSAVYQINNIFNESGIFRAGESKHEAKLEARLEGLVTPGQIASSTGIFSYSYAESCRNTWFELARFAKSEFGLKDMTQIRAEHVQKFMQHRAETVSRGTWNKEAAHVGKFGDAVRLYLAGQGVERPVDDYRAALGEIRKGVLQSLPKVEASRGFSDPKAVISALSGPYRLVASVQYEGGARLREAAQIKPEQLRGLTRDTVSGREVGRILLTDTKGGKIREIQVRPSTYREIHSYMEKNGILKVGRSTYRAEVGKAATSAGESARGTHDFRYCYAQERYGECIRSGMVGLVAMQQVSWEMGHERADITIHYLK